MRRGHFWVWSIPIALSMAGCRHGERVASNESAIEEPAEDDTELPVPIAWLPDVGLTIDGVTYTEPAVKGPIAGRIAIKIIATIPADQPDFSTSERAGWRVSFRPRERVIFADGTKRASAVADNNGRVGLPVTAVAAWEPDDDGLVPGDLGGPVTGPRPQHLELTIAVCSDLRQPGDPAKLRRERTDCIDQPIDLALPCGEATPVRVWFDNGYMGERAVTPSDPFTFTRSGGDGCTGPALGKTFEIVDDTVHFVPGGDDAADPVAKLFLPIAHNIFPGYSLDGVSRIYISIVDRSNAANNHLLITSTPRKPPTGLPLPGGASEYIVAGFHDDAFDADGNRTALSEETVLPCGEPRHLSVWHEFLNVPGSLTQTPPVLFTRTEGRGCGKGGRP